MIRLIRDADSKSRERLLDELTEQYVENSPDPDKPTENRKQRGREGMQSFLDQERKAGRPRPGRKDIEAKIRRDERISNRQLQADLIETYDELVALGLVPPRA